MSTETELIKLLSNRDRYEKYSSSIDDDYFSSECNTILINMGIYFDTYIHINDIDLADFKSWLMGVKKVSTSDSVKSKLSTLLDSAASIVKPSEDIFKSICKKHYGDLLYDMSYEIIEDREEVDSLEEIIVEYHEEMGRVVTPDSKILKGSITDLIATAVAVKGLPWPLTGLQKAMGDLKMGDLIMVGGRPDAGKTSFLAHTATHMIPHMKEGEVVLWFNNEEGGNKVRYRVLQSTTGLRKKDIDKDPLSAQKKGEAVFDRVLVYDDGSISVQDITKMLRKYDVGLVIIDQLSKLHGFEGKKNDAERLRQLAEQARNWAKQYAPVIFTVWADGTAEGQRWIDMSQLYGSKTGLQGEVDAIITIGRDNSDTHTNKNNRYLYIPKNKLEGEDPLLRNGMFNVQILPEIARYRE